MKKRLASVAAVCAVLIALSPVDGFKTNAAGESVSSDASSTLGSSASTTQSSEATTKATEATTKSAVEKNYIEITGDAVNVRAGAGTNYKIITSVKQGKRYKFYDTKSVNGVKWYKIKVNNKEGWIIGSYVKEVETGVTKPTSTASQKQYIEITEKSVNVRAGAGTHCKIIGTVKLGKRYKFYATKTVDGEKWYKIKFNNNDGWVAASCVKLVDSAVTTKTPATTASTDTSASGSTAASKTATTASQKQYIEITEKSVNVRAGAGTHCKIIGTVKLGKRYKFYATKTVDGEKWYKIKFNNNDGWVAASCVKLVDSAVTTTTFKTTTTTTTTTTVKPTATTTASKSTTTTTKKTTTTTAAPKYYVLVTGNNVNVRSGAGTNYGVVTTVQKGQELIYLGVKTVNGQKWYNVEVKGKKGWIIGTYAKPVSKVTTTTKKTTTTKTAAPKYYVLVTGNNVNVRSGTGTNYGVVTTVQKGQELTYLGVKTVNGQKWYNVEVKGKKGWIIGTYAKLVSKVTTMTKKTTTTTANNHYLVVKGGTVYVRSGAGASYPKVTTVYMGQKFQYSDVKTVDKIKWYKITANGKTGWISGAYVKVGK